MKRKDQFALITITLLLVILSFWSFSMGVEPLNVLHGKLLIDMMAGVCIAAWGFLSVYLYRGMSKKRISLAWCPILLLGAFSIVFLIIGCFGFARGV